MGAIVLPPSTASRGAAVVPRACASRSRIGINPACIARPAAAKKPKRPGSFRGGEPPAKRVRGDFVECEPDAAAAAKNKKRPRPTSISSSPRVAADAASLIKNLSSASWSSTPESVAPLKSSISSMSELIAKARLAKTRPAAAEAVQLRDIERRRAEARRELEQMAPTVEFNDDPFIDWSDVTKSRRELIEAKEEAGRAQVLAMARPAAAEAIRLRDIQRRRAEARRQLEQIVRTVEFNDPFIDPRDDPSRSRANNEDLQRKQVKEQMILTK